LYGTDHDGLVDLLIDEQLAEEAGKLPKQGGSHGNFIFFHLMSPHAASGREASPVWTPARNRYNYAESEDLDAAAHERMTNHYDNSILQADGYIAHIFESLSAKGLFDDAIVVITGDHGEALADRTPVTIGHGRGMYQESIQVPLIFWDSIGALPQTAPLADHTDIAPTILAMLGIAPPAAWQGMSVWSMPQRRHTHIEHIAHRVGQPPIHMEAVVGLIGSEVFKAIRYRQAGGEILRRTFCLSSDPEENRDLSGTLSAEIGAEVESIFREYHAQPAIAFSTSWKYLERYEDPRAENAATHDPMVCPPEPI
jgi:arylsulfatase A-like enzyme